MDINEILKIENTTQKVIALHQLCNQRYQNWTETERFLNAVLDLESDVMNGGFIQYFDNKDKEERLDAIIGLEKIGAIRSKELLEKAEVCYQKNELHLIEVLDQDFFEHQDNIVELVISYAENHTKDFSN